MPDAGADLEMELSPLTQAQEEDVCRIWAEVFCSHEPVTRTLGVSEPEFLPFARACMESARPHRLSFLVTDRRTGELLGFRLLTDVAAPSPALPPGSKLEFLFDCFYRLQEQWAAEQLEFPMGQWAYSIGVSVRPQFTQRGIARQIYRETEELLAQRGFLGLIMHCTNAYTTDICRQLGYREVASLGYDAARDPAGRFPFREVPPPHRAMTLFERRLSAR